jgi:hypothetical protein
MAAHATDAADAADAAIIAAKAADLKMSSRKKFFFIEAVPP